MAELLDAVTSWRVLVLALVVFGFAPGCCLRLIVLTYPREDPRRKELIAELRVVPRIERPLWVAEQLEVGLFEGLRHRVSATICRRRERAEPVNPDAPKEPVNPDEPKDQNFEHSFDPVAAVMEAASFYTKASLDNQEARGSRPEDEDPSG